MGAKRIQGTLDLVLDLPKGMAISVYGHLRINPNRSNWRGSDVRASAFKTKLVLIANTTAPASTTPAYPILDMLNHMGACLTGREGIVQSSYYSQANVDQPIDGGGSHRLITNGFFLRGFLEKPVQLSMQTLMQSLQAIDAVGMAYKPTPEGDVLVIEPIAYWYRDTEVLRLTSFTVIEESVDTNSLHPSVEIGYSKFPDEGPQVLDEFNTRQEYTLPQTDGVAYQQVSDLIASGYAIEQTRRVQFSDNPSDSTTYDDDCFIICATQSGALTAGGTTVTIPAKFTTTAGKGSLVLDKVHIPTWLAVGVSFVVAGSGSNAGLWKVLAIESTVDISYQTTGVLRLPIIKFKTAFILNRSVTIESGTYTLSIGSAGSYTAERDESFELVEGVLDPETSYNLRLAPRFNLLRHAPYFTGSMVALSGSEVIRTSFSKNNTGLRTKLADNASGDLNIGIREPIDHSWDLYLASLRHPIGPLWAAETVKVETKLTLDQMLYLRACFQGTHPDPFKHYGYITLAQGEETIKGFPLEISFVPATGQATILLRKRIPTQAEKQGGKACNFYGNYTFADFEQAQANEIENWIEGCSFTNFQ